MIFKELRGHLRAATPLSKRDHLEDAPIAVGLDVDGVADLDLRAGRGCAVVELEVAG